MSRSHVPRTAVRPLAGIALLAVTVLSGRPAPAVIPRRYTVTDLGSLRTANDGTSSALALNEEGQVVGVADADDGSRRAFRWTPGVGIQDLRDNGVNLGGTHSLAAGINDGGQIVGEANTQGNPFEFSHAFVLSLGLTDLNGQGPFNGGQNSRATAVNASGAVAGWAQINGGAIYPFRWRLTEGIERLFTPQAVGGKAFAINNAGTAAGSMDLPGTTVATVWPLGGGVTMISFRNSRAQESYGLNDNGRVVGARRARNGRWAAWMANLVSRRVSLLRQPPGAQQSWAYDVNNKNQIVGAAGRAAPASQRAVIWEGNRVVDLNTRLPRNSRWRLTRAHAINESGQIVGEGIFQGRTRAFLLTPG